MFFGTEVLVAEVRGSEYITLVTSFKNNCSVCRCLGAGHVCGELGYAVRQNGRHTYHY